MFHLKRDKPDSGILSRWEMFEEFTDVASQAIVLISPDHEIIYMNRVARSYWGDSGGSRCYRVMRKSREVCHDCPLPEVFDSKSSVRREQRMSTLSGWQDHETLYIPARGPEAEPQLVVMVSASVEDKKVLEREAARASELSQTLLESMNALVMGVDEDGNVAFINKAGEEITGYSEKELKAGGGLSLLVSDRFAAWASTYFGDMSEAARTTEPEIIPIITKSGGERMISWIYTPLSGDAGSPRMAVVIGQDVTDRLKIRDETEKRTRELETVNIILSRAGRYLDIEDMIEAAVFALLSRPGYSFGAAYMLEKGGESARLTACYGLEKVDLPEVITGAERTWPATSIYNRKIETASASTRMHPMAREILEREPISGLVAVPLVPGGHPWGMVLLGHVLGEEAVAEDTEILRAAGEAIELGIENAYLRERAEARARQATALVADLAASEQRYHSLLESVEDVVFTVDLEGKYTFINESVGRIFGREPCEIIGRSFLEFMPEEYQDQARGWAEQLLEGGRVKIPDFKFNLADGTTRYLDASMVPLTVDGKVAGATGIGRDVTERIASEEALRESEERYRTLVESSQDSIFLVDANGDIIFSNSASHALTGLQEVELVGRSIYSFVHPEDRDKVTRDFFAEWRAGRNVRRYPVRSQVDGVVNYFEVTTAVLGEPGPVVNVMVIVSDVSDRERAQRDLAESEERYRTIVEASQDVIVVANRAGEILYTNRAVEAVFGIPPEDVLGRSLFRFIDPADREATSREITRSFRTGQTTPNSPVKCVRADGSHLHVEVNSGLVGWPGEAALEIMVIRDVTDRRHREKEGELKLKLEETLATISARFVDPGDMNSAISETMEGLGALLGADRSYYFEVGRDGSSHNVSEWVAEGTRSIRDRFRTIQENDFPWWFENLRAGRELVFDDIREIPGAEERDMLVRNGTASTAVLPVFVGDTLRGFVGLDSRSPREWRAFEVELLRDTTAVISRALERREWVEELGRSERFRKRVTESVGEGLMVVTNGVISWANRQATEIFGYTTEEMIGEPTWFLMPDEERYQSVAGDIVESIAREGVYTSEDRALRKDGTPIDIMMSVSSLGEVEEGRGELVIAVRDITEAKRLQHMISASAEAYSTLFSTAGDGYIVHTLDGEIKDVNERACAYSGFSREELLAMRVAEVVVERARPLYPERRAELERDGFTVFETRLQVKSGEALPVEITARKTRIWGEEVVLSAVRDITERKKADKEIKRRAGQLASLNRMVKAATSSLDLETMAEATLEVAVEVTGSENGLLVLEVPPGKGEHKVLGVKGPGAVYLEEAYNPERLKELVGILREIDFSLVLDMAELGSDPMDLGIGGELGAAGIRHGLLIPLKSGEKMIGVLALGAAEQYAFGETDMDFYNAIGSEIGVSVENALIYRELTAEHERLSLLYRSTRGMSGEIELGNLMDTLAKEAGRAVAAEASIVVVVDEQLGQFTWRGSYNIEAELTEGLVLPLDAGIPGYVLEKKKSLVVNSEEEMPEDFRPVFDSAPLAQRLSLSSGAAIPLMSGDTVLGVLGVINPRPGSRLSDEDVRLLEAMCRQAGVGVEKARLYDETRKHLEALEKAHRELMELDRMKSDFVSTVSHELRSPLAVIEGFAKTLVEHYDRVDEGTKRESLDIILKKSIALEGLIENILDMSRIEDGRLEVNVSEFDLLALCEEVREDQDRVAEAHRIILESELETLDVTADAEKVEVALANLVRNAVKFSPDGGPVTIRVAGDGGMAAVEVTDDGIGIPPDEMERIFERFYQVDSGETRSFPGSGLGLYITRELVHSMGGEVSVESEPGKGSTFCFTVPLAT